MIASVAELYSNLLNVAGVVAGVFIGAAFVILGLLDTGGISADRRKRLTCAARCVGAVGAVAACAAGSALAELLGAQLSYLPLVLVCISIAGTLAAALYVVFAIRD